MKRIVSFFLVSAALLAAFVCSSYNILYENDQCQNTNGDGICKKKTDCPQAEEDVDEYGYHNFTRCGFDKSTEIVCCPTTPPRFPIIDEKRKSQLACDRYNEIRTKVFPQIAFGVDALPGEFPHIAALGFFSESRKLYIFSCAGTLISEKFIVTAAHCILNSDENEVKIARMGEINVPLEVTKINSTIDYDVKNAIIHPKYHRRQNINDIALVELIKSVKFRIGLRPACLFANTTGYPDQFTIAGWGLIDNNENRKDILQKAIVSYVPRQTCLQLNILNKKPILESQVCAVDRNNKSDTCTGDSGGPLQMKDSAFPVVVGITSYGSPYCGATKPSIYTSVTMNLDWIEQIVWP